MGSHTGPVGRGMDKRRYQQAWTEYHGRVRLISAHWDVLAGAVVISSGCAQTLRHLAGAWADHHILTSPAGTSVGAPRWPPSSSHVVLG